MKFLKNHPFAVEAFFESSIVLTFAVPKDQVQGLIPECLELDSFQDKWAFIAVAMVQTRDLRPKGFPRFMGNDFFLIGYRIFVRYIDSTGKRLRGLYIIRSETNKKGMEIMGNLFTHYNYTTTDIEAATQGSKRLIRSRKSNFELVMEEAVGDIALPAGSPFADWKEARRYAGPLPHTFTYDAGEKAVLIIEGVRENWKPEPLMVRDYSFQYLESLNLQGLTLANAFEIRNIPYYWRKGRIDKWQ